MKHNFKKIISILLVVVMCLGAFPVGIFAEGDVHNHADETTTVVKCPACQTTDKVAVDHVVENATCTDAAGTWYVCTNEAAHATSGGRYLWLVQTAPALHANGANLDVNTEHVDATCTDDGVKASWICSVDAEGACGKLFIEDADGNPVATNVDLTDEVAVEAALKIAADDSYNANINEGDSEVEEYHDFGEWTEVQKFQCGVKDGIWERVCSICEDKQTKTKDKDEHNFDWTAEFEKLGSITCTQEVTVTVTCKNAGCDATATRNVYGWNHDYIAHSGSTPDCLTTGQWDYYSCKHCNKLWVDGEDENSNPIKVEIANMSMTIIPAVGHDFEGAAAVNKEYKAPTCTEDGNEEYHICAKCHEVLKSDAPYGTEVWTQDATTGKWGYEIDKLDHDVSETITAVDPATCTEEGYGAHYKCTRCDAKFSVAGNPDSEITGSALAALVIAKIPHVFGDFVPATTKKCTEGTVGTYAHLTCAACNNKFAVADTTVIPGTSELVYGGHGLNVDFTQADEDAIRGEAGAAKDAAILKANAILVDANIVASVAQHFQWPSLDGTLSWVTEVPAAPEGEEAFAKLSHNWRKAAERPVECGKAGYIFWECADCDLFTNYEHHYVQIFEAREHKKLDGSWNITVTESVETTCDTLGNRAYAQCNMCLEYFPYDEETETPNVLLGTDDPDDFKATVYNATNHENNTVIVAPGAEAIKAPTCNDAGVRACSKCSVCNKYYTWVDGSVVNLTIVEADVANADPAGVIDANGNSIIDDDEASVIPKHKIVNHAEVLPDCSNNGNVACQKCTVCENTYFELGATEYTDDTKLTADEYTYTLEEAIEAGAVSDGGHDLTTHGQTVTCRYDGYWSYRECSICEKLFGLTDLVEKTLADFAAESDEVEHIWKELVGGGLDYVTAPTPCEDEDHLGTPGVKICTVCNLKAAATQHDFSKIKWTTVPTCLTAGVYYKECTRCGTPETVDGVQVTYTGTAKLSHAEMGTTHVEAVPHTCTEDGNFEYWECNYCHVKFVDANCVTAYAANGHIDVAAHTAVDDLDISTQGLNVCTPAGVTLNVAQKVCTACNKYWTVDALGAPNSAERDEPYTTVVYHKTGSTMIPQHDLPLLGEADCLTDGYVQIYKCDTCLKFYKDELGAEADKVENAAAGITSALGHTGSAADLVPQINPSCISKGVKEHIVCTRCGEKVPVKIVDGEKVIDATAEPYDDATIEIDYVNHVTVLVPGTAAHCTSKDTVQAGTADTYRCTVEGCGKLFTTENPAYNAAAITEAPAVAHTANFTQHHDLEPLCADWGYDSFTCTCGYVYYVFTHPLGHDVVSKNETYQAPTCVNPGKENYYYCRTCAMSYADAACTQIKYKVEPNAAEGIAAEYYTNQASAVILATGDHRNADNAALRTNCVNADGTAYLENIAVTDRFCTSCERNIDITNHVAGSATIEGGSTAANCQSPASEFKICTACDQVIPGTQIFTGEKDPDEHVTVKADGSANWVVVDEVACGEDGLENLVCVLCDTVVNDRITTRAHDFTDTTNWVYTESICGVQGYITKTCKYAGCGAINTEQKLPALATTEHNFENVAWIIDDTKAFDSDMSEYRICANTDCDHKEYRQRQDVKFTVSIDNAIVPGAVVVNSGTIAVTIKLSANNRPVNALTFSFQASNNLALVYDGGEAKVDTTALADNFNWIDIGVDNNNIVTVSAIMASLTGETTVDGINVEFITLYFNVANNEPTVGDIVYAAPIDNAIIIDGDNETVDTTVGLAYSKDVYYLGDFSLTKDSDDNPVVGDGNDIIDLYDVRAMMTIIFGDVEYSYDARADVNKDGIVDMVDFAAIRKFNTDRDYYKLINVAS